MRVIHFFCTLLLCLFIFSSAFAENTPLVSHHPQEFLDALQNKDDATVGKAIFEKFCASCHAIKPLISLGAPRIGIESDWQLRIAARNAAAMLKNIDAGLNAMPPRGGCFECSDKDLLSAINYILPKKTNVKGNAHVE